MHNRKICIVTGTRADYGLLYGLMKEIESDVELTLQLVVTGMHLSPEFGLTYKFIEQDGFSINEKVEMLLSADTSSAITKSIGLALIGFAGVLERLKPDLMVVLGDRTEAFAAAQAAMVARIPIAHLHGGEITEGAIDEAVRHSITKMAHLHFVAAESYRLRVIQLGENPEHVYNYGAPGIENITRLELKSREELEENLDFKLGALNFLVTYHPVTLQKVGAELAIQHLLEALDLFPEANIIFTKPNADSEGRLLIERIQAYAEKASNRIKVFSSLGQVNYLSAIKHCDVVIGNSSSGLLEVPSFRKPTVNIGHRQSGRLKADSVIDCEDDVKAIVLAIRKAISPQFQELIYNVMSPYDGGATFFRIKEKLKQVDLKLILFKKFNDLTMK